MLLKLDVFDQWKESIIVIILFQHLSCVVLVQGLDGDRLVEPFARDGEVRLLDHCKDDLYISCAVQDSFYRVTEIFLVMLKNFLTVVHNEDNGVLLDEVEEVLDGAHVHP